MPESFGARLRQRREQQEIALATIGEQTKIKVSLLEGLERDDLSHWPDGIFRRAFIRAYAQAINLDPAAVLQEFLALHPESSDFAGAASAEVLLDGAVQAARPPTRLRFLVGSALGSLSLGRPDAASKPASTGDAPAASQPVASEPAAIVPTAAVPTATVPTATVPTATVPTLFEPDLAAVARLCTELSGVDQRSDTGPLLAEAARILDAVGIIIWVWHAQTAALWPVLAHGYSDAMLAQLQAVRPEADNATAAAFRSAQPCLVDGSDRFGAAVVVPLMIPGGCGGVLAIELPNGRQRIPSVSIVASIFAAQLARWIRAERQIEQPDRRLA